MGDQGEDEEKWGGERSPIDRSKQKRNHPLFSLSSQSSTLRLRVRVHAASLSFTVADAPCRLPRHARLAPWHWPMLGDGSRARALADAACRAVADWRAAGIDDVHVLDAGAGSGLLGVLVAR